MGADDWLQGVRGGWGGGALGVAVKVDSARGRGNVRRPTSLSWW